MRCQLRRIGLLAFPSLFSVQISLSGLPRRDSTVLPFGIFLPFLFLIPSDWGRIRGCSPQLYLDLLFIRLRLAGLISSKLHNDGRGYV